VQVLAAHRQAWEITDLEQGALLRELLDETDPVRRVWLAAQQGGDDRLLARLITAAIATIPLRADQHGVAVIFARAFADRDLTPAAWAPVAELSQKVLVPRDETHRVLPGSGLGAVREIQAFIARNECDDLDRAFLRGVPPDCFAEAKDWRDILARFRGLTRERGGPYSGGDERRAAPARMGALHDCSRGKTAESPQGDRV
jgi:hypothetical protein